MTEVGLSKKVFRSLTWVGTANALSQILSWAITIVIVRQLTPDDFGLMAMAVAFWTFLTMIGDFGLFASIVQSKEVSKSQFSEIFGFIIILNVIFFILTFFFAPIVSSYFAEPRLTAILRTLGIVFIFIPFGVIPNAVLIKEMNFPKTSVIDVLSNLCGGIVSLVFALSSYGVWSLVYGTLGHFCFKALCYTLSTNMFIKPSFRLGTIKGMLSFSSYFTGGTILRYFSFKSDIIVGGRFIGSDALGIYSIANQLAFTPVEKMSSIIPQVAFSAFSKMQYDMNSCADNFLKSLKLLNMVFIPCYITIFVLAEDIVITLLGPKWDEIILPIRILCIIMPFRAIEMLILPAMNGLGKSNIAMKISGYSLIILTISFLIGIKWGYIGLSWAWVGGYALTYIIIIRMCIRHIKVDVSSIALTYIIPSISSTGLFITGYMMLYSYNLIMHPLLKITAYLTTSVLLYSFMLFLIDRPTMIYLKSLMANEKSS